MRQILASSMRGSNFRQVHWVQASPVLTGSAVDGWLETGGLSVVAHPAAIQPRTRAEARDRIREEYFMVRERDGGTGLRALNRTAGNGLAGRRFRPGSLVS